MIDSCLWRPLGELFEIGAGKAMSANARSGSNKIPFLRTSNVLWDEIDLSSVDKMSIPDHELPAKLLRRGDLLVCEGGEIGRAAIWNGEIATVSFQNHVHRLRPIDEGIEPRFYVYFLQCAFTQLGIFEGAANRTTIPNLSRNRLASLEVPKPGLNEQRAIVTALSRLRRAINLQDRLVVIVRYLKRAVTASLFTRGLSEGAQKDTEIGTMPMTWDPKSLSETCDIWSGGTPRRSVHEYWTGEIPWASGKDIKTPSLDDTIDHLSAEGVQSGSRMAPEGAVLLLVRGMALAKDLPVAVIKRPMAFNQDVKALVPRDGCPGSFLRSAIYFRKEFLLSQTVRSSHGTMTLNLDDVQRFKIPFPADRNTPAKVAEILDTIDLKVNIHERKRDALDEAYRALLFELMTGHVVAINSDQTGAQVRTIASTDSVAHQRHTSQEHQRRAES
jgi:type I restriction enzyme S subunit